VAVDQRFETAHLPILQPWTLGFLPLGLTPGYHQDGSLVARKAEEEAMLARLVAGGQSGVDRAALHVALELGIPCGGWCPKGRKAEDGTISGHEAPLARW